MIYTLFVYIRTKDHNTMYINLIPICEKDGSLQQYRSLSHYGWLQSRCINNIHDNMYTCRHTFTLLNVQNISLFINYMARYINQ